MCNLKLKNSELIQEELNNLTRGLQTKFKVYKIIFASRSHLQSSPKSLKIPMQFAFPLQC